MKIQGINTQREWWQARSFKCHKGTTEKMRYYGKVIQETGTFKGYKLDIFSSYDTQGNLLNKFYYLTNNLGQWVKSKVKYFKGKQCYKVLRSERNAKND